MNTAELNVRPQDAAEARAGQAESVQQHLTFTCGGEEYGVDILRVQEIKGWIGATHVPGTPECVLGVMNLRGAIVPVVDLRLRLRLERCVTDSSTVVVVVRVNSALGDKIVGMVVDAVSDVRAFAPGELGPPPSSSAGAVRAGYIRALAALPDRMVTILDVDALLAGVIETG